MGAATHAGGQPGPLQGSADNRWWMGMPEGESGAGREAQQGDLRDAQHEQVLPEGGTMSCAPGAGRLGTLLHGEQLTPRLWRSSLPRIRDMLSSGKDGECLWAVLVGRHLVARGEMNVLPW